MRYAVPAFALLLMAAAEPASIDVPPDIRQAVIARLSPQFAVKETAIWEFDSLTPYILGGTLVCGKVNFQNSLRRYMGMLPFYIVVKRGGATGDSGIMPLNLEDDPTGTQYATYRKICKPAH
jgi:hypothetical protein